MTHPTLAALFEHQASETPDAAAVRCGSGTLTYGELDRRANQLAHHLQVAGVGSETLVGLLIERSLDLVVGVLGILKAGGAYVPVDPTAPADRIATIFRDAGVSVAVTQDRFRGTLPPTVEWVVAIDGDADALGRRPATPPLSEATEDSAAYVIYTSGSTGVPKGVVVTHGNVRRLFTSTRHWFDFGPNDVWTLFHSIAFDVSVGELWGALLHGGTLVVVPQEVTRAPDRLLDLLESERVTVLRQTPSAFRPLMHVATTYRRQARLALRYIVFAGEALDLSSLAPWITLYGDERPQLINMYGITETTVDVTYRRVRREDVSSPVRGSMIGEPIPDLRFYLLGPDGRPVQDGEPGEIYVGGAGVALGYLNRDRLTAERFLPDPFADEPGQRMYRSGDQAIRHADGDVEYLGRLDQQVKIRGFRIEPGEVTETLRGCPGVRDVAVVARDGAGGEMTLVAYVVPERDGEVPSGRATQVEAWHEKWTTLYQSARETLAADGTPERHLDDRIILRRLAAQDDFEQEWREFQQHTLAAVRSLDPRRVLEIGCGTGQVLLPIAGECEYYLGTDFAALAIDEVRRQLDGQKWPHVEVRRQAADDFTGIEPGSFDTVIINSVIQYFPDVAYLIRVLEGAATAVAPGGRIFVGDVQSRALLTVHHLTEQLERLEPDTSASACREIAEHRAAIEDELVVDPGLFEALPTRVPRIAHVECRHRQGRVVNETTRFHYDVLLHCDPLAVPAQDAPWLSWSESGWTLESLRSALEVGDAPPVIALSAVPNRRSAPSLAAWQVLEQGPASQTVRDLLPLLHDDTHGLDPEEFWALGKDSPWVVDIRWSDTALEGAFDVLIRRRDAAERLLFRGPAVAGPTADCPWPDAFSNDPSAARGANRLPTVIRDFAKSRLPDYMVPSAVVLLEALPLTANGKLDVRALPSPDGASGVPTVVDDVPRTDLERQIADVWAQVLRIDDIGVREDFFERGGHSLLAVQVIIKLRERLGIELSLGTLFEAPTVQQLAQRIEAARYVRQHGTGGDAEDMEEIEL